MKATESMGEMYDRDFERKIDVVVFIAGAAKEGKWWWEAFVETAGKTLRDHFDETADRIDDKQLMAKASALYEGLEVYIVSRRDSAAKTSILERAHQALLKANVCRLEVILFRIMKKSRKPGDRIKSAMASFSTEDRPGGRKDALGCLGPPVRAFLHANYEIAELAAAGGA